MWDNVRVIDKLGTDLTVVNSARVSFAKYSKEFTSDDDGLIKFLAKNKHYSPFRHCLVQFHIKMPEFVARQFYKHIVGSDYAFKDHAWNEISGRYVKYNEILWKPDYFRKKTDNIKQGSLDEKHEFSDYWLQVFDMKTKDLYDTYIKMVEDGIPNEQARAILPLNFYTEFYWTASLQAIQNFVVLRLDKHAQKEIRDYAIEIDKIMSDLFPVSWKYLMEFCK